MTDRGPDPSRRNRDLPRPIRQILLGLSGAGFPLTQLAIRRSGRRGALLVAAVCGGLLIRDVALLRAGVQRRLRPGPATLLWFETGAAALAVLTGLRPVLSAEALRAATDARPSRFEALRRVAIGTLFGLHTLRFRIYLQPHTAGASRSR